MTTPREFSQLPPLRVKPDVRAALEEIGRSDGRNLTWVLFLAIAEFLATHADGKLASGDAAARAALVESVRR